MKISGLSLIFIVGIFVGMVGIDIFSHVVFDRYYEHNMHTMYLIVGLAIGLIFSYFFKDRGDEPRNL